MDLYYSPISAFSHKVRMALFEKGVAFNPIIVNLADPNVKQEYRALYPLGKVPCIKTANELVGESTNIIEWIDNHYQVNKLLPEKAEEARRARYWDRMADQYITQNAILLFFQSLKEESKKDVERIDIATRQIAVAYDMLEAELKTLGSAFLVGNKLSLADISMACGLVVSQGFIGLEHHPKLQAYFQTLSQRECFAKAREGFDAALVDMMKAHGR